MINRRPLESDLGYLLRQEQLFAHALADFDHEGDRSVVRQVLRDASSTA